MSLVTLPAWTGECQCWLSGSLLSLSRWHKNTLTMIPDWAEVQQQDAFSPLQLCCDVKIWFLRNQYFTFYATVNPKIEQWDNLLQINILESLVFTSKSWCCSLRELTAQSLSQWLMVCGVTSLLCTRRAPGDTFLVSDWLTARQSEESLWSWSAAQCQDDGSSSNTRIPDPPLPLCDKCPGSRWVKSRSCQNCLH